MQNIRDPIQSLNETIDMAQSVEMLEEQLAMELLEERLELACWDCALCFVECNTQCRIP
jgi:hypothetical protein